MLLTTIATAALGAYTLKAVIGIVRDQDVCDALRQLKHGVTEAAHSVRDGLADTAANVRQSGKTAAQSRQNGLLVSSVLDSATEQDRKTVLDIFQKYVQE